MKKMLFIILGCICFALGTIGIFLPILPTTPLYLATLFFFAHSSEKLRTWFVNTKLYEKHLDSYVKGQGMTRKTKGMIILNVTILMGFGFYMMFRKEIFVPCIILGVVWIAHIIYFLFFVKTVTADKISDYKLVISN